MGGKMLTGCSETGEWETVEGTTYYGKNATTTGNAWKQEAVSHLNTYSLGTIYKHDGR